MRDDAGMRLNSESIVPYPVKNGVTISFGHAVSLENIGGKLFARLPAGANDVNAIGCSIDLEDRVGDADGTIYVNISMGSQSAPFISSAAIGAGKSFASSGTDGRVAESVTAGAVLGKALNAVAGADLRVWGNQTAK